MTLLRAEAVSLGYGRVEVVHDVDLRVRAGEVVAVLGPNGSGKSTLLAGLAGVLQPRGGTVTSNGRIALARQAGALAARSARANVEIALTWWGVSSSERRTRAMHALEQVGIADLAKRHVGAMSGGQRRRVHLARAMALHADVLMLDEPFTALDVEARDSLLDDVAGVLRSSAQSVVLVVHDRSEAWALADRVVVMMSGRLVADDKPGHLLAAPPTPEVARFLGFTGEVANGDERILLRAAHVLVDPRGQYVGTITRRVRLEAAVRLDVRCDEGQLQVVVPEPGPEIGATIRLSLTGGARFAASGTP